MGVLQELLREQQAEQARKDIAYQAMLKQREERKAGGWPEEKQRRSRVNWAEIIPPNYAIPQIAFEKRATIGRLRELGYTFAEIGGFFGVVGHRIRQMHARFERDCSKKALSPAEIYLSEQESAAPRWARSE